MKQHKKGLAVWLTVVVLLFIAALWAGSEPRSETVQQAMRDAVLHDINQVSLFGLKDVNPGLISAFTVTAILLIAALCIRIFAVPRFRFRPGKLQMVLEEVVGLFDGMARSSSPHRSRFVGAYIFAAGAYIFVGTLFELLGLQAVTTHGHSITLPAPLSDINAAIAMGPGCDAAGGRLRPVRRMLSEPHRRHLPDHRLLQKPRQRSVRRNPERQMRGGPEYGMRLGTHLPAAGGRGPS